MASNSHLLSFDELMTLYQTSFDVLKPRDSFGLSLALAKSRLLEVGPNILTPPKKPHPVLMYLECVVQVFNLRLIFCAVFEWILFGIDTTGNSSNVRRLYIILKTTSFHRATSELRCL